MMEQDKDKYRRSNPVDKFARWLEVHPQGHKILMLALDSADREERIRIDQLLPKNEIPPSRELFDELFSDAIDDNVQAQFDLAFEYLKLCRDESFFGDAAHWMNSAANKGHAEAQFWFGYMHEHALGAYRFKEKITFWYQKAIDNGHLGAMNNLGKYLKKYYGREWVEGLLLCNRAGREGLSGAQLCFSFDYKGLEKIEPTLLEAVLLREKHGLRFLEP